MEEFFTDRGITSYIFQWFVLPLLVYSARILDVSMGTVRILLMMNGRKKLATFLGFCESLIWVTVISTIFKHVNNPLMYLAYAGGYATGTFVGMTLESRLAVGKVIARFITRQNATQLIDHLRKTKYGFTNVKAEGHRGDVNLIFSVIERKDLSELVGIVKSYHPKAFYSIETTKYASEEPLEEGNIPSEKKRNFFQLLSKDLLKRK